MQEGAHAGPGPAREPAHIRRGRDQEPNTKEHEAYCCKMHAPDHKPNSGSPTVMTRTMPTTDSARIPKAT